MADKDTIDFLEKQSDLTRGLDFTIKSIEGSKSRINKLQARETKDMEAQLKIVKEIEKNRETLSDISSKHLKSLAEVERLEDAVRDHAKEGSLLYKKQIEDMLEITQLRDTLNKKHANFQNMDRDGRSRTFHTIKLLNQEVALTQFKLSQKDKERISTQMALNSEIKKRDALIGQRIEHTKINIGLTNQLKKLIDNTTAINKVKDLLGATEFINFAEGLGLGGIVSKMNGPVLASFVAVYNVITFAWKTFKLFDEDVFRLRKNLGLMGKQGSEVQRTARLIAREYASIGVTITQSVDSLTSLSKAFGSVSSLTKEMVATTAAFSAQLGISEDTSANVQKNMAQISGKSVKDATSGMMGFAQSMSVAAEVPLPEVMNDLANLSESVRTTFRGNTMELIKATVEARRMGLSIESLGKTSEGLLDFNTSVNSEMEASVLLGKNINFIEARRKAFAGDILGANKEILKTLKSVGDFDKLNMFQKKALAQATGKTVEELQNMLQREKNIELIRAKGSGAAYDSLMLYEKQMKLKEKEGQDLGKAAEADVLKMANQARMNVLMQQFQQMMMDLSGPVMDLMEPLMRIAVKILPTITAILSVGIAGAFARVFLYSGKLTTSLGGSMIKWIGTLGRAGAFVARIGLGFARIFPPIAIVVGIVSSLYGIFKEISLKSEEISKLWSEGKWWQAILTGIKAVAVGIIKGLLGPFEWVFDWIADNLGGKSPSKIGLMIVKGIESVGTMLLDALMYPFKSAYTFITELFGKIPEFISSVFKRGIDFAMKLPGMGLLAKAMDKLSGGTASYCYQPRWT